MKVTEVDTCLGGYFRLPKMATHSAFAQPWASIEGFDAISLLFPLFRILEGRKCQIIDGIFVNVIFIFTVIIVV